MTESKRSPSSSYRDGYQDAQIDHHRNTGSGIGIILGCVLVAILGVGGWLMFGSALTTETEREPSTKKTSPDINVDVEAPKIETPDINIPVPSGESDKSNAGGESSNSESSQQ